MAFIDGHRERFGVEPICRVLSEHRIKIAPERLRSAELSVDVSLPGTSSHCR